MIAVALSGGVDSAAAAIWLHEKGEVTTGFTLYFGSGIPKPDQVDRAARLCRHLGISHHVLDVHEEFHAIKSYFCREYLAGRTPNPCAICNRDIKFGHFLERALSLGAEQVATGHYVRKGVSQGRYYLAKAREPKSQEYFLGLLSQRSIERSFFPLEDMTRKEAERLVSGFGMEILQVESSQDACFIGGGGYVSFIESYTESRTVPGDIIDIKGRVIGRHKGVLFYTVGQRKGLGIGFGRRLFVLSKDADRNTITVGERHKWPLKGFALHDINFMKAASLCGPMEARVKVRYRQEPEPAVIYPTGPAEAVVDYQGIFAPGQLAVFYDSDGAILCAGLMDTQSPIYREG